MNRSPEVHIPQVEDFLKGFGEHLATAARPESFEPYSSRFDRPVVAALLTFLICAPGCSAATVFLMKADADITLLQMPPGSSSSVMKSDRLPLGEWSQEAANSIVAKEAMRKALYDPAFLALSLIGDSPRDIRVMAASDVGTGSAGTGSSPASGSTRKVDHAGSPAALVIEQVAADLAQPGFLEKLFATRFL
jgi:hypothetical protein